jgi:hypothetical protein
LHLPKTGFERARLYRLLKKAGDGRVLKGTNFSPYVKFIKSITAFRP